MTAPLTSQAVLNNTTDLLAERNREHDKALALAQSASRSDPGSGDSSDTVGLVMVKKGMVASGLHVFRSLIQRYPKTPVYRRHLVAALLVKGDREEAKREVANALQLRPAEAAAAVFETLLTQVRLCPLPVRTTL